MNKSNNPILLLGGSGYIGTEFQRELTRRGMSFFNASRKDNDYTTKDGLHRLIIDHRPRFLINVAGFTGKPNVDACEIHKQECLVGNAVLPGVIREVCQGHQLAWGHVSSGCIYTGSHPDGSGFRETDPPNFTFRQNNCSFYSGSKALGEEMLEGAEDCFVWRLRIPFNNIDSPRNYISKVLNYDRLLNVRNSLSQLSDFVSGCLQCVAGDIEPGIYNLTNAGSITTEDVVEIIKSNGLTAKQFEFFRSEEEFMKIAAKTPRSNCVLDCAKAIAAGIELPDVYDAVDSAIKTWQPSNRMKPPKLRATQRPCKIEE